jgi:hypothetical protein
MSPLGRLLSGEFIEREGFALKQAAERQREESGVFPLIKPEAHFVAVGRKMLGADAVPRADDPALQQGECGFHGIGMDVALNVDFETVANRLVLIVGPQMAGWADV